MTDEVLTLIRRAGDIKARMILTDLCDSTYHDGLLDGAAILFHAEMYLKDRLIYELFPPPFRNAIPMDVTA